MCTVNFFLRGEGGCIQVMIRKYQLNLLIRTRMGRLFNPQNTQELSWSITRLKVQFIRTFQIEVAFRIRILTCWLLRGWQNQSTVKKPLGQLCRTKNESQPQTLPTYDFDSGASTRTTLVGVECCHHCTTFTPQQGNKIEQGWCKYFSYRGGFFYFIPFLPSLCLKQFSLSLWFKFLSKYVIENDVTL